jgi:hypothetical protein
MEKTSGSKEQKLVAITGDITNTIFYEVSNAGFDAFIPKPLTEERFHEIVHFFFPLLVRSDTCTTATYNILDAIEEESLPKHAIATLSLSGLFFVFLLNF